MAGHQSVLVTGGGGFIAPHLLARLDEKWDVTLHLRDPLKIRNFRARPRLQVISGPLTCQSLLRQVPDDCQLVIHLAGAVHGPSTGAILESNVVTTQNVLSLIRERNIPRLLFMSTAAVWDDSTGIHLDETTEPCPTTLYGYAKLSAECLIRDAISQNHLLSAVILRCNNTYGRGNLQGVVANFRSRLLNHNPVQIDGDGQQLREPLYISDLIEVLTQVLSVKAGLHTYGISGSEPLTIIQMAETMARILKRELRIDWKPPRSDRSRHLLINTEKAQRELNWAPRVRFEQGIRLMCEDQLRS